MFGMHAQAGSRGAIESRGRRIRDQSTCVWTVVLSTALQRAGAVQSGCELLSVRASLLVYLCCTCCRQPQTHTRRRKAAETAAADPVLSRARQTSKRGACGMVCTVCVCVCVYGVWLCAVSQRAQCTFTTLCVLFCCSCPTQQPYSYSKSLVQHGYVGACVCANPTDHQALTSDV